MKKATVKPDDLIRQSLTAFVKDVGNQYPMRRKDQKFDTKYLLKRFDEEGFGFVTKTLPAFGKHFDKCLLEGKWTVYPSFKKDRRGVLPLLLNGLLSRVFNHDGTLLKVERVDTDAIRLIRQFAFMFYKLELDYPKELVDGTIKNFVDTDNELRIMDNIEPERAAIILEAQKLVYSVFKTMDPEDISPRPGPGQNADKIDVEGRYEPHVLYKEIHEVYPYYRYFYCSSSHLLDRVREYRVLPRRTSGTSKLSLVPKDSRGPRIICMEPPEYMWLQQGLGRKMMAHIESHPLTRGHVNFYDQTINGKLALEGSRTQQWSTLDMKEASDRISTSLVELLFDDLPRLKARLIALSTKYIELPDGSTLKKRKYAPMGSALCFPVESIIHYALAYAAYKVHNPGVHRSEILKNIYVYGDDLIVKQGYEEPLFQEFPQYGLKFNEAKSCYTGYFRESCGIDAFYGVDITPQKVKKLHLTRGDGSALSTQLAMFHGFYKRGLWEIARVWQDWITSVVGYLPYVTEESGNLGWIVDQKYIELANKETRRKWCSSTQQWLLLVRKICARPNRSMIGGWETLMRYLTHVKEQSIIPLVPRYSTKALKRWIPFSRL